MNITDRLVDFFNEYRLGHREQLEAFYHPDIHFQDPVHEVHGITDLLTHFDSTFANAYSLSFRRTAALEDENQAFARWSMIFHHPQLKGARSIAVDACSYFEFKDKRIIFQRDYFDLGQVIYEQLPLVGRAIRLIKQQIRKN